MQTAQHFQKIKREYLVTLDSNSDLFIPSKLIPETVVSQQYRVFFVHEPLSRGIKFDQRQMRYGKCQQYDHRDDHLDRVVRDKSTELSHFLF